MPFRDFKEPPWRVLGAHPVWWLLGLAVLGLGTSFGVGWIQNSQEQGRQADAFAVAARQNGQSLMDDFRTIKQDVGTLRASVEGTLSLGTRIPTRVLPLETGGRFVQRLGDQRISSVSFAQEVDRVHTDVLEVEIGRAYPSYVEAGLGAVVENRGILPLRDVDFGRERYEGDRRAVITTLSHFNESNNPFIAFDLATSPTRQSALLTAAERRQLSITEPLLLITTGGNANGFLLVDPLYNSKHPSRPGGTTVVLNRQAEQSNASSPACDQLFRDVCASFASPEQAFADYNASNGDLGSCSSRCDDGFLLWGYVIVLARYRQIAQSLASPNLFVLIEDVTDVVAEEDG